VYQTAIEQLKGWRQKLLRLQLALSSTLEEALTLTRGTSSEDYTAMINCINAKGILVRYFAEQESDYHQKILPRIKVVSAPPQSYVARIARAA
jgi:hypothetical protein